MEHYQDTPEDIAEQERIRIRANYSASVLGKSFISRGGGYFLNIKSSKELPRNPDIKHIDDSV